MIFKALSLFTLVFCLCAGQRVQGQDFVESSIASDPYAIRENVLGVAQYLCQQKSQLLLSNSVYPTLLSTISSSLSRDVLTSKINKSGSGLTFDSTLKGNKSGTIRVLFSSNEVSFTYKQSAGDLESIASVQMNSKCAVQGSFNTYYDSNYQPIVRVKFDQDGNRIRVVKIKEPILDLNVITPSDALPVGMIDTGVDYNHPELAMKMRPFIGLDLFSNDHLPYDYTNQVLNELSHQHYSHGTAVADLITRDQNVRLIPVRVYSNVRAAGKGIEFLASQGVRIINLSMGSDKKEEWMSYLKAAKNHPEILFVVAAGNEGLNIDKTPTYPAAFKLKNQIVVASTNASGELSEFSNYGSKHVDIAVWGEEVPAAEAGGGHWRPSGTSFSAPQLTRFAASILLDNPTLTTAELKAEILGHGKSTAALKGKVAHGIMEELLPADHGKINLCTMAGYANPNCQSGSLDSIPYL